MPKILIVDDEPDIRSLVRRYAEREGYEADEAANGLDAVELCRKTKYDVVIMDAMMPGLDGFAACEKIRSENDIPVIMLSARGEEDDKLFGFDTGADDYVVKPFSPRELMARIKVVITRHRKQSGDQEAEIISFGKLKINTLGRTVLADGVPAELTAKEYDLLMYFVNNSGIVLTREQILNAVWGYDSSSIDRTVDWQVKQLRGHLRECRGYIVTIRGVGYKFEERE